MKKLRYLLLSLLLVFSTILPVSAQEGITVSLRVENTDATILEKTTISGVTDQDNDGTITPMDVLTCAVDNNYLTSWEANSYGYADTINSISVGSWMYAVDNSTLGYEVSDGSSVVYYPYDYNGNYAYFDSESYTVSVGTELCVQLLYDVWGSTAYGSNVSIVGYDSSTSVSQTTDDYGKVALSFDTEGTYKITNSSSDSRAYAQITVSGSSTATEKITNAVNYVSVPSSVETGDTITLPSSSLNGVSVSWSSSNIDLITNNGEVVGAIDEDTDVTLTATFTLDSDSNLATSSETTTKDYTVTVLSSYDAGTLSDSTSVWYQNGTNQSLTDTLTSTSEDSTDLKWSTNIYDTISYPMMSDPVIVEEYVYVIATDWTNYTLNRLDKDTGELLKQIDLIDNSGYLLDIAYGNGMLFVTTGKGIQALNESNLVSLWYYYAGNSVTSDLTYYNGYLYAGIYNGTFFALDVSDDDTTTGKETKTPVWTYTSSSIYYYNQAAVIGDYIYFAGDDGVLVKHSLTGDNVSTLNLDDAGFRGGISYDDDYLYIISRDATLYKVSLDTFKVSASTVVVENGASTSTPTIYNDRIYVGGSTDADDFYADGFISVIDADTLEVIAIDETDADVKCQPLVTTAYDGVVVYFTCNSEPGGVYYIIDYEGNTSISAKTLYTPVTSSQNYNMNNVVVDEDGVLYFTNDSNTVFALYNTNPDASTSLIPSSKTTSTSNGESSTSDQVATYDHTLLYRYMTVGLLSAGLFVSLYNKKEYLQ